MDNFFVNSVWVQNYYYKAYYKIAVNIESKIYIALCSVLAFYMSIYIYNK